MPRLLGLAIVLALVFASRSAHADRGDRWDGGTISYQVAVGTGGLLLGATLGGVTGYLIAHATAKRGDWATPLLTIFGGIVLGGAVGTVIGVQEAGDSLGGTGRTYATSIGMIGSIGVLTAITTVQLQQDKRLPTYVLVPLYAAVIFAGPIVGYHASADEHASTAQRVVAVPLVTVSF
jgi:hypothetical protein